MVDSVETVGPASTLDGRQLAAEALPRRAPALTILMHPDPKRAGERVRLHGLLAGTHTRLTRTEPLFAPPYGGPRRGLDDRYISRKCSVEIRSAGAGVVLVRGQSSMPIRVDGVEMDETHPVGAERLDSGVVLELAERVVLLLHRLLPPHPPAPDLGLVGASEVMEQLRRDILRVADLPYAVLVRGESGSGKELVASAIHEHSDRASRPFVSVNMAAVPASTAASELFGHTRGAFTGASTRHEGFFGRAHRGTLFLDEIAEAGPDVQAMLLRVLETGELQPVGASSPRTVDVRLLAATDADLAEAVQSGAFRSPLLHRLSGYPVTVPALREHRDDIGTLLVHFLNRELEALGEGHLLDADLPWLSAANVAALALHRWPGNVRELRNVARQIAVASRGEPQLRVARALAAIAPAPPVEPQIAEEVLPPVRRRPSAFDEDELIAALRANRWRMMPTAAALGISRSSLYTLVDRSERIRKASDVPENELRDARAATDGDLAAMSAMLEVSARGLKLRLRELELE